MEMLVIELVMVALKLAPKVVDAIEASTTLSAEAKAKHIENLKARLDEAKKRVAAVKFRDI